MDIDEDTGFDSCSSVNDEVPSCDTSCSSSLMSIEDSESEYSDFFDYDDDNTNSSSSSESTVPKVCMLVWSEFRYICRVLNLFICFFGKGSEETYDYLFQVQTTSQRTQKTNWCNVHVQDANYKKQHGGFSSVRAYTEHSATERSVL